MMNKVVGVITLLFLIVQKLPELIQIFELDNIGGIGAEKKQVILDIVDAVYDTAASLFSFSWDKTKVMDLTSRVIDAVVKFFNVVGFFTHSTTTS
mgnify:CR=1 FL=1